MSQTRGRYSINLEEILAEDARLSRLHRLFKSDYNVPEPSIILEPYLYLGNCISAQDIYQLDKLGIRYVLNVASRDVEVCPYYSNEMRILTIDLRDDDQENILRVFDQAFAFIDQARKGQSKILVHCSHGQSRSPAIVLAYLMRTYHVSLEQCLVHVVKARSCVLPNDGFLKQLILYDRLLAERRRKRKETAVKQTEKKQPAEPVYVVPIQVPEKIPVREKASPPKRRQSVYQTEIVKRTPVQSTRSQSAHTRPSQGNRSSPTEKWNVTRYYPPNFQLPEKKESKKLITEIYDKATNRFIVVN